MRSKHKVAYIMLGGLLVMVGLLGMATISWAEGDTWTRKADMPTARAVLSTSVVNGKIYAIGGKTGDGVCSTVEVYDPATDTWTKKADMPTARAVLSTSVVNGKIYAIGGTVGIPASTVEVYDPATDTWTKKADMPTARYGLSTSVVNGKIYAIGGEVNEWMMFSAVEEYNPATDTWTQKANMSIPRSFLSTSVVNSKIYAIGGAPGGFEAKPPAFGRVEEYDPGTDTWTRKADMPTGRWALSTSVVASKIYAIAGELWRPTRMFRTMEEYDPVIDTWTQKADMPGLRTALSTSVVNGKIYAIGGSKRTWSWTPVSTVEEYDPGLIVHEIAHLREGPISATETVGSTRVGQPTPLDVTVALDAPLEETGTLRRMVLDLSPLGIPSDLPLEPAGDGRYTASTTVTPFQAGEHGLLIMVENEEGERGVFLRVQMHVYAADQSLYDDQIGSMWEAKVTSGELDLAASDVVHRGSYAQAITLSGGSILRYTFEDPDGFSTTGYATLEFWIHPGTASTEKTRLVLKTTDAIQYLRLREDLGITLQPNVWQVVSIPLENVGLLDTHLKEIMLRDVEGTFHLDDVVLAVAEYRLQEALAVPQRVKPDGTMSTLLTVQAMPTVMQPGASPTVTVDLTPIGGQPDAVMVDDGTGGDEVAGDGIYSLRTTVDLGIQNGLKDLVITSTDRHLRLVRTRLSVGVVPVEDMVLYGDEVETGWNLRLFRAEGDPTSTEHVHGGSYAYAMTLQTMGQVDYQVADPDGLPTFGYSTLEFWVNPGSASIGELKIVGTGQIASGSISLVEQMGLSFEPEQWQQVFIPLEALDLTDAHLVRIRFTGDVEGTFYIDEMRLVAEEIEEPTAPASIAIRLQRATGGSKITAGKIGIRAGDPADFAASVTDAEDNPLDQPVAWRVEGEAGTVDANGHFIASTQAGDTGALIATADDVSDTVSVTIIPNLLKRIEITPASVELDPGARVTFKAQGYDAYGNAVNVRPFWHVTRDIGTISSITGTFIAGDTPGSGDVVVFAQTVFGDASTEVTSGSAKIVVRAVPEAYALSENTPNPFNPTTTISYNLPTASDVTLTIYTVTGQKVAVLTDAHQQAGRHRVRFDGSGFGNGVYLYRLEAEGFVETKRMLLLK